MYADATFTTRLTYGAAKGWEENGKAVTPFTTIAGLHDGATGQAPYELPKSGLDAKKKVGLATPMHSSTDNDVIGGNSGSSVVNAKGP